MRGKSTTLLYGVLYFLLALGSDALLHAQSEFFARSNEALAEGNRLLAVECLTKGFKELPGMESVANQYLPLISDYHPTTPFDETVVRKPSNEDYLKQLNAEVEKLQRLNAIQTIAELAKNQQIVILNEAHDCPQHRAFGLLLAAELKKVGFEFLAMETLVGPDGKSGPVAMDYPTLKTGHYSAEPVFGDFVRQAGSLGFQLFAYEIEPGQRKVDAQANPVDSIKERENAQSDNLIEHILKPHPNAKLFIYVGYSHATENWETQEDGTTLGWMAAQIQKKTGIDPLTIDQVGGSYNPKSKHVDPVLSLLQNRYSIQEPTVFQLETGAWVSSDAYYQKTDLTVFHPIQKMIAGRPDWLRMDGYRKPYRIQNRDFYLGERTLLQAFYTSEGEDALPVDQLLLESADAESTFLLPEGDYRTRSCTINGKTKAGPDIQIIRAGAPVR